MNVRNWGLYLNLWAFISISLLFIGLYLSQIGPNSLMRHSTYTMVLPYPKIWLASLLAAIAILLPIFIRKRFIQVVKEP